MENSSKKIAFRMTAGVLVAITIIVAIFASGVTFPGLENNPSLGSEQGRLTVLLKDAPVDLEHLMITISDLEVHNVGDTESDGGWMSLLTDAEAIPEFDLLAYQGDETLNLADIEIPVGTYNKIRMFVSEAKAIYFGSTEEVLLTVPSGKIDVITEFELFASENIVVLIDMEPDWVAISKSKNLRPVLKATISELNPKAEFTYSPAEPTTGQEITFTSIGEYIDGTIASYAWDFGDGNSQTGVEDVEVTHVYVDGTYTITLTVTDNDGLTGTQEQTITIPYPPLTT